MTSRDVDIDALLDNKAFRQMLKTTLVAFTQPSSATKQFASSPSGSPSPLEKTTSLAPVVLGPDVAGEKRIISFSAPDGTTFRAEEVASFPDDYY